jgi:tetratricopeptide (TPR) repeat protein/DNA-binding Xre family transcriptional regulator
VGKNVDISKSGLPERLRRIREEKNVPSADLAEKAGITARTLHDIETGQRPKVQETTIHRLADALGVTYAFLLHGSQRRRYVPVMAAAAVVLIAALTVVVWRFLHGKVPPPIEHPRVTTASHEAYEHYVLGNEALKRLNREDAKTEFRAALEIDSTFAMAAVRLTDPQIRGTNEEAHLLIEQAKRHAGEVTGVEKRYIASRDKFLDGDYDGAIAELREVLAARPDEAGAYVLIGVCFERRRAFGEAANAYENAVKIDPHNGEAWNALAYVREGLGDFDGALDACDRYSKERPYDHNPHDTKGDILARNGHPHQAVAEFEKALKLRPDFYPSMQYLGCIYLLLRNYPAAAACFHDMTLTKDAGARGRGRLFAAAIPLYQGKLEEGMTELDRALEGDSVDGDTWADHFQKLLLKASILAERGKFDDAIAESRRIVEKVRENGIECPAAWMEHEIRLLARAKKFDEARAALDSSESEVRRCPGRSNSHYWMGKGWLDLGLEDFAAACADFERAYDVEPMFYNGFPLCLAYIKAGRPADAVRVFEKISRRYMDERAAYPLDAVEMYYYMGVAYQETGRARDAAKMYREFLDTWKNADPVFDEIKLDAQKRLAQVVS